MNYFSNITKTLLLAVVIFLGSSLNVFASWADTSFDVGTGANNPVQSIVVQPDGKVLVGGQFTTYDGISQNKITRLNTDGSLDTSFDVGTGANHDVYKIALQSDGKVLVGGQFTTFDGVARAGIARLNTDGSLDTSFVSAVSFGIVRMIIIQPDGKILVGARYQVARLNTDGSLDTSFDVGTGPDGAGTDQSVFDAGIQSDGKIIIGGDFTTFDGIARAGIARLNTDGSLDTSFVPGTLTNPVVTSLAIQSDGKIITGEDIKSGSYYGSLPNGIDRLNADGSIDSSFNRGYGAYAYGVHSVILQSDGKIIIGGGFFQYNYTAQQKLARLNTDGTLDTTFSVGSGPSPYRVNTVALQSDGKIIIGGVFSSYNGTARSNITRINFNPFILNYTAGPNGSVTGDLSQTVEGNANGTEVLAVPDTNYYFVNWSDGSTQNPRIDSNPTGDISVTANFSLPFSVNYYSNGFGTIGGSETQNILPGQDAAEVVAIPDPGYRFLYWDDSSTDNPRKDTNITTDIYMAANFEALTCGLINVGNYPISATTVGTKLYVMNSGVNTVSVIDTTTNTVIDTITVGTAPNSGTLVGTDLYVMNSADDTVSIIDTTDNSVSGPITVGDNPLNGTLVGTNLYVLNYNDNTVSVIDTTDNSVSAPIAIGSGPISATAVGTKLYVMNQNDTTVAVIDTTDNSVLAPVTVGSGPNSGTLVGTDLYVMNSADDTVSIIDTTDNSVSGPITVGDNPINGTLVGTDLYVLNYNDATVSVIDTSDDSVSVPIAVGNSPTIIVSNNTDLYVLNSIDSTVSVIDTTDNSVSAPIAVGNNANYEIIVGTKLYVVNIYDQNYVDGAVTVVDTNTKAIIPCATTYSCAYLSGSYGSITGSKFQTVADGANTTPVTAVPSTGYSFSKWSDDSTQNPRTDTNVTGNVIVSAEFIETPTPTPTSSGGGGGGSTTGGIIYGCTDRNALNYQSFVTNYQPLCKYASPTTTTPTKTLGTTGTCPVLLTQNLKSGSRNGKYNSYTKGIVKEAKILQSHLNRLGFSSGPEDGILGPKSDGAIKRMQTFLNTKPDGYVGPNTRVLINNSCGVSGLKKS